LEQAQDFFEENEALNALLLPLTDADYLQPTLFKGWTIDTIMRHLHVWNIAADLSLRGELEFTAFMKALMAGERGRNLTEYEADYLDNLSGAELRAAWADQYRGMTARFAEADPKARVKWVGPDMSIRSSISARLMETWAHAQAVYDVLGKERIDTDRIGNIVRLGINTYGWTFKNRTIDVPQPIPFVRLTAPSGLVWDFGDENAEECISGSASEFCQVVTQTRNIADTALTVTGQNAQLWMSIAQCFAGPPNDPPAPGQRHKCKEALA
jgi:uncharacterized protein (TIGR03084 family)